VPWKAKLLTKPYVIENGELLLPSGPGWGTAVNEAIIRAHPAKAHTGDCWKLHSRLSATANCQLHF
jgi:hypothetical protein